MKKLFFIIFCSLFFALGLNIVFSPKITPYENITINKGDGLYKVNNYLDFWDEIKLKVYTKINGYTGTSIVPGRYDLKGQKKSIDSFLNILQSGPKKNYTRITVIEGYSKYDIDDMLTQKGLIQEGEYIDYVSDGANINNYKEKYKLLQRDYNSLEGFLYPDTYYIDGKDNVVSKLVGMQLDRFEEKIYDYRVNNKDFFYDRLDEDLNLDFYDVLILSSIVEKEEFFPSNKPIVAGILLNRLENNMRLDADITLCYGLAKAYKYCDGDTIITNLDNSDNVYNTRVLSGLTPSPISNPNIKTFSGLINYKETDSFYYLHDKNGKIYTSKTLQEHNFKKSKHLGF